MLIMPPPPGMIRSDGIYPGWDAAIASSLPSEHRLLAYYSTFEDRVRIERQLPPISTRDCLLQLRIEDEKRNVSPFGLRRIRSKIEDSIEDGVLTNQIAAQVAQSVNTSISAEKTKDDVVDAADATNANDTAPAAEPAVSASAGNARMLGWFGKTKHSFGYSVATDVSAADQTVTLVTSTVVAAVNGRVLQFQTTASQENEEDRQWAEETALLWSRVAISANREYNGISWFWLAVGLALLATAGYWGMRCFKFLMRMRNEVNSELKEIAEREAKQE